MWPCPDAARRDNRIGPVVFHEQGENAYLSASPAPFTHALTLQFHQGAGLVVADERKPSIHCRPAARGEYSCKGVKSCHITPRSFAMNGLCTCRKNPLYAVSRAIRFLPK